MVMAAQAQAQGINNAASDGGGASVTYPDDTKADTETGMVTKVVVVGVVNSARSDADVNTWSCAFVSWTVFTRSHGQPFYRSGVLIDKSPGGGTLATLYASSMVAEQDGVHMSSGNECRCTWVWV